MGDATRRRRRIEPTDEWEQLKLLCLWPEQLAYEEIRPTALFGVPVAERAEQTGSSERTLYRKVSRFEAEGVDSLFASEGAKRRGLPPAMRRLVVDLKAEHPPMRPHEIATVCYVRFGRRPDYRTVERVLSEEPMPLRIIRRYPPYHEMGEPRERRAAVVRLHAEGWNAKSIAGYLKTARSTVYRALRRWIEEGTEGLDDRPNTGGGVRKADLKAYAAVRRIQENPALGAFRVRAALAQIGIHLSARTVGRILAVNRALYGLEKPSGGACRKRAMPFASGRLHEFWTADVRYLFACTALPLRPGHRRTNPGGGGRPVTLAPRHASSVAAVVRPLDEVSTARASGRQWLLSVLQAPGRPVDLDRHPVGGGPRFDQFERSVRAGVGEQPRALADDCREDEQVHLVDQVVVEQPPDQGAAAVHLQLTSRLGLQLPDGGRDLTGEDGRVRPLRVGERGRRHVLGHRVQRFRDGVDARICHCSPGAGEDLVGPSAEQERVSALVNLVKVRPGLVVPERRGPSAAVEPAAAVLVPPADALHHSVDGDERGGRQLHGRGSLLVDLVVRSDRAAPISSVVARSVLQVHVMIASLSVRVQARAVYPGWDGRSSTRCRPPARRRARSL
jgi:transposase